MRVVLAAIVAAGALLAMPAKGKWKHVKPSRSGETRQIVVKGKPISYYRLDARTPIEVLLKGKKRLRIHVRCEVGADAQGEAKSGYTVKIDGKITLRHEFLSPRSKTARFEDAGDLLPGRADSFTIDIPAGEHRAAVSLDPGYTGSLYLRFYVARKTRKGEAKK